MGAEGGGAGTAVQPRRRRGSSPGGGVCGGGGGCGLGRLVRKLRKQSRTLCAAARPGAPAAAAFQCQYDPLSYALNFDRDGFGTALAEDDASHLYGYTFSSRFVLASATSDRPVASSH